MSRLVLPSDGLLKVGGKFICTQIRSGKVIDRWESKNVVVNEGLNLLLNNALAAVAAQTAWYLGVFSGNYTPQATDTAATIASNSTEFSGYSSTTRPAWTPQSGGSTAQSLTNAAAQANFTITTAATLYGAFLVSSNTISGTTGDLMAASQFSAPRSLAVNDQLLVTYALSAVSG